MRVVGLVIAVLVIASVLTVGIASANEAAGAKTRVRAFDPADGVVVGIECSLTREWHQGCEPTYADLASDSHLAARGGAKWPKSAGEMDDFLGMPGRRVPDGPNTPGRGKVEWRPTQDTKITFEQHPYHPDAPDWHRGTHWHLDTPGNPHQRYLLGDPIPGYNR